MSKVRNILILTGKNAARLFTLWLVKLLMLWSVPAFGQSSVSIVVDTLEPDTVHLCKGDTLQFSIVGDYTLINNNFNSGELGYGWSYVTPGFIFQAPCDTIMADSYYLWFGDQTPVERTLTTLDMNLTGGGQVSFSLKFGKQGDIPSCEGPDEAREGVSLQYSTDFGLTWQDITYYCPNGTTMASNPGTQLPLTYFPTTFCNWNHYTFTIPLAAQSPNTRIRWIQNYCSYYDNHFDDNWGLDNIKVSKNIGPDILTGTSGGNAISNPFIADSSITFYAWIMTSTVPPDTAAIDSLVIIVHELPVSIISGNEPVCFGDSISLSASGNSSLLWSNGQTGTPVSFVPVATQQLILTAESEFGCRSIYSTDIVVYPLPTAMASNDSVCEGSAAVLLASGGSSYLWSNGQTTAGISIPNAQPSLLTVTVTDDNACSNTAFSHVYVLAAPEPSLPDEFSVCYGDEVILSVEGWPEYSWSNGSHSSSVSFYPLGTQTYSVTVTDPNGCIKSDSVIVYVSPRYQVNAYSDLDTVCSGEKVELHATGGLDYEWSNGKHSPDIEIVADNISLYTVTITNVFNDRYCSSVITVPIEITDCYNLYFANAFSPKGYNPIFKPIGELGDVTDYYFIILDRWGNTVFETKDPYSGWDGTDKGQFAPVGVYVWKVQFTLKNARRIYEKMGSVLIVE
jgi:hypothetical protein